MHLADPQTSCWAHGGQNGASPSPAPHASVGTAIGHWTPLIPPVLDTGYHTLILLMPLTDRGLSIEVFTDFEFTNS